MKEIVCHWDTYIPMKKFECKDCWCIFNSNEYHIEHSIILDKKIEEDYCPECWGLNVLIFK